jgi:hypothetical protein
LGVGSGAKERAKIVIRARVGRLAAAVSIGSLLAIQVMAGSAGAAVPSADATSQPIPASYTAGHAAGFRGFYHLTDTSTLSKLYLRIDVDPALATNVYKSITRNGAAVTGNTCDVVEQDVICTFKTVRSTDFFVAVAAFAPAAGQTQVIATYLWSSTGVPQNGDNSHGDAWDGIPQTATLTAGDVNYGGAFTLDGDRTVQNSPVGPGNVQATKLVGLPVGVAATVRDGPGVLSTCVPSATVNCDGLFGEWIEVFVGDGLSYPVWQIQATYASGTPKSFVHTFTDANGDPISEPINTCAKKSPTIPCFTWDAKTSTATILTTHNGTFKGR